MFDFEISGIHLDEEKVNPSSALTLYLCYCCLYILLEFAYCKNAQVFCYEVLWVLCECSVLWKPASHSLTIQSSQMT
jgi:hypothetical protein